MLNTVRTKFTPCLYAALTTIAGFGSLLLCDIKPVIHFGWMMSAGILLSLLLTFILFPSGIVLLKKPPSPAGGGTPKHSLTTWLAEVTHSHGNSILAATVLLSVFSVLGVSRLVVENSFIDYFKKSTEIYQGMKVIDQQLGGTTPLDVIVKFDAIDLSAFETMRTIPSRKKIRLRMNCRQPTITTSTGSWTAAWKPSKRFMTTWTGSRKPARYSLWEPS
jgi:predicted RND superfamily exporter protein